MFKMLMADYFSINVFALYYSKKCFCLNIMAAGKKLLKFFIIFDYKYYQIFKII